MQYALAAAVALAIGGHAAPQGWSFPSGGFQAGSVPAMGTGTGVGFPAPTGSMSALPLPTGTGLARRYNIAKRADDDEGDDEESSSNDDEEESSSDEDESSSSSDSSSGSGSSSSSGASTTEAPTSSSGGSSSSGGEMPASKGSTALDATKTVAAGESFDGGMVAYDRGVANGGQGEGGESDAVFRLEEGATLSNVIIGPNQAEGVHCFGSCTLKNVWWADVGEDAFTIKEQGAGATTTITGGGAFHAEDKVLQHNGGGTLKVTGFTCDDFGKLYRSCGNCDEMSERHIIMDDITASNGKALVGINTNYGDTATLSNIHATGVEDLCTEYTGNDSGDEPELTSSGPSESCKIN